MTRNDRAGVCLGLPLMLSGIALSLWMAPAQALPVVQTGNSVTFQPAYGSVIYSHPVRNNTISVSGNGVSLTISNPRVISYPVHGYPIYSHPGYVYPPNTVIVAPGTGRRIRNVENSVLINPTIVNGTINNSTLVNPTIIRGTVQTVPSLAPIASPRNQTIYFPPVYHFPPAGQTTVIQTINQN